MQHILTSLRPCRSHLQGAAKTTVSRLFNFEAPQLSFLATERTMIAPGAMQRALRSSNAESDNQKPDVNEPKPDTPDDVAPEIKKGAAPIDADDFNLREGGEGGPGNIPKKSDAKEQVVHRKGEGMSEKPDASVSHSSSDQSKSSGGCDKMKHNEDGSMGPDSVGDTHRIDYSH
jgi:hypothetical protein